MFVDILKDYKGDRTPEVLVEKACEYFEKKRSRQNIDKQATRKILLAEQPELRLRLNTLPLRKIIEYSHFKCSPFSSVARDEGIRGSDIDGAVVVSQSRATLHQQLAFVRAIRDQGFEAYHEQEVSKANKINSEEADKLTLEGITTWEDLPPYFQQSMFKVGAMMDQTVLFFSQTQIKRMIGRGRLIMPLIVYLAGKSLDE
jgi:hypothetical protein